jgi:hypothetical protein
LALAGREEPSPVRFGVRSYTHALSARNVQRKVIAELAYAEPSLDQHKSRQFVHHSDTAGMITLGTRARPELHIPTSQLKRD